MSRRMCAVMVRVLALCLASLAPVPVAGMAHTRTTEVSATLAHVATELSASAHTATVGTGEFDARSAAAGALQQPAFRFVLVIRDASSGVALVGVDAMVTNGGSYRSDSTGTIIGVSATDRVTVTIRRVGYTPFRGTLRADGRPQRLALNPLAVSLEAMNIRSRVSGLDGTMQSTAVVSSQQLAERMAASIAAVIAAEPGIASRSNGPMATQPVIRGLTGDRVLVLEDGLRTGDIATTAPDHAITIEPATAKQIDVIRGPGGLLYGSNTLGGVVNVVRDDVPRMRPSRREWSASSYVESVNAGVGAAAKVQGSVRSMVWQLDASRRTAGDTRTPRGHSLPFTDVDGFDAGIGVSVVRPQGFAGVAVREYRTRYGVPSSYDGITLPGAHDGGVYVDARRTVLRTDAELQLHSGILKAIALSANGVRFAQAEFEREGFVGTRFGQLAASGDVLARFGGGRHTGAIGVAAQWRDLRAAGSFTGTRPAVQTNYAAFAVDEVALGRLTILAGVRVDRNRTAPLDSTETLLLRDVRTRAFHATTGALGARVLVGAGVTATVQVARAFRPPSIEELFSAGPHLASYSYEVGLPSLAAERGSGTDGIVRWQGKRARAELAAYRMRIANFITFAPQIDSTTGLPLRDPRLRRYNVYRPVQGQAHLSGVEGRFTMPSVGGWSVDLSGAMPRGRRHESNTPLPSMPAATLRADVRRTFGAWSAGIILDQRFAQPRVPRPPEDVSAQCTPQRVDGEALLLPAEFCPTDGVLLVGATLSIPVPRMRFTGWHTALTISVDNLLDEDWRDPLWRAKQVAPQPGRNVRFALRVTP